MRVLGIDVGLNGAIALVEAGKLLEVHDMPTLSLERNNKTKRMVNAQALHLIIRGAKDVLQVEFPRLAGRIAFHIPDEKDKRHGQAVAAASLPELAK